MKPINSNTIKCTSKFTGKYKTRTYKLNGKTVTDHHYGIDLTGGKDIIATSDGKVTKVVNKGANMGTMCQVVLKHADGWYSRYYHLESGSIVVKTGDYVTKGQKLGLMGNTGKSSGKHLHFQIDKGSNSNAIDPYDYVFGTKELKGLPNPKPTPTPTTKLPTTHTVKKGDSISAICKKYYGTYTVALGNKIVNANKKKYPKISLNYIVVGWKLTIPA